MTAHFTPPYPKPAHGKISTGWRFLRGLGSWAYTFSERSYTMKLGEINLPKIDFFIPNEAGLVSRILEKEADQYPKHHLLHEMLLPLLGESVFTVVGKQWEDQRKMINPAFAHTNLNRVFGTMSEAVAEMVERIDARDLQHTVDIDPLMTHVTADVIFRTLLSTSLDEQGALAIYRAFDTFQKYGQPSTLLRMYGLPNFFLQRPMRKGADGVHAVFKPLVKARYDEYYAAKESGVEPPVYNDILQSLLEARHPESGEPFSYKDLVDQTAFLFLAGHETSASGLTWTLYLIAKCPELQEELFDELKNVLGEGEVDAKNWRELKKLGNVFKEGLRLYPPVTFFLREVLQPTEMRGKKMKKGAMLIMSPWLLHRNSNYWKCPHAFDPERFEREDQKEACKQAYMPFSKGPRICVGAGFAQQEAVIVLAQIVRRYRLRYPGEKEPVVTSRLTMRPKHGIKLMFEPREG